MTCMCTEMRTVKLCMDFPMNFKSISTWQANSASASDNKMPIELHTLCAILMCHIKSKHKASATGPTQMCFFQIPPARSWASLFSKHHENTARHCQQIQMASFPQRLHETSCHYILPRLTYKRQYDAQDTHKPISTVFGRGL